MNSKSKSRRNLPRFSYESTGFKGWRVSVTRFGDVFTRYFSDRQYGSMAKAMAAAQACLKAFRKALEEAPVVTTRRQAKGHVVGVSETTYANPATGEARAVWVASWPEAGRRRVVKFPVQKFGARKARQMAIDARRDAEQRLGLGLVKRLKKEDVERLRALLASL